MQQELTTDYREEARDQASAPVGDFVSAVLGFASCIFAIYLPWYTVGEGSKAVQRTGLHFTSGIICFIVGACVFAFALVVLVGGFINPRFRLMRSPGWVYGAAASLLLMVSILGLVAPPKINGVSAGIGAGLILELFAAAGMGVASILKF